MRATFVKGELPRFRGDARLYRLDPPMSLERDYDPESAGVTTEYVVVSATEVSGEPETYVFAADAEGNVSGWTELDGSFRGGYDHERALRNAGYDVEAAR